MIVSLVVVTNLAGAGLCTRSVYAPSGICACLAQSTGVSPTPWSFLPTNLGRNLTMYFGVYLDQYVAGYIAPRCHYYVLLILARSLVCKSWAKTTATLGNVYFGVSA